MLKFLTHRSIGALESYPYHILSSEEVLKDYRLQQELSGHEVLIIPFLPFSHSLLVSLYSLLSHILSSLLGMCQLDWVYERWLWNYIWLGRYEDKHI